MKSSGFLGKCEKYKKALDKGKFEVYNKVVCGIIRIPSFIFFEKEED
ncbi:MAG: hypothetical protein J6B17_02305 [Ruminococcus sp.]|nr:hypothetical protein [Ruminococcus sp.]